MRLHGHWRSLAAMRVRIALALKGLAWEEASVDILGGGQFDPAYLAVNPQAVVPALEAEGAGGPPLFQSLAILEWRGRAFTHRALSAYELPIDDGFLDRVRFDAQRDSPE